MEPGQNASIDPKRIQKQAPDMFRDHEYIEGTRSY